MSALSELVECTWLVHSVNEPLMSVTALVAHQLRQMFSRQQWDLLEHVSDWDLLKHDVTDFTASSTG